MTCRQAHKQEGRKLLRQEELLRQAEDRKTEQQCKEKADMQLLENPDKSKSGS
jgi:hypothetical protein